MINDLPRLNALVGQLFDERMVAQVGAESKQFKFLAEKTKAMSKYALVVMDSIDEQGRTKFERAKAVAEEREE